MMQVNKFNMQVNAQTVEIVNSWSDILKVKEFYSKVAEFRDEVEKLLTAIGQSGYDGYNASYLLLL